MTVAELEHFRDLLLTREENLNELMGRSMLENNDSGKVQSLLTEIKGALEPQREVARRAAL